MINWFKGIHHPEAYHGLNNKSPFFEGWYNKVVTAGKHPFAIIPGIYRSGEIENNFPFIMIFDGKSGDVYFERFDILDFSASTNKYDVIIGENRFFQEGIDLKINSNDINMTGSLRFSGNHSWPVKLSEPGCMGWYGYMPFMECYHGILSMDHVIQGELVYNGSVLDFNNGRGYIEKDWGSNFPNSWIWVQANHFKKNKSSISASIARIPFLGLEFAGFIIGLLIKDKLYRFTTYRSAKTVFLDYDGSKVEWVIKQKNFTLSISIIIGNKSGVLYAPDKNDMVKRVSEYLDSKVVVRLQNKKNIIFEDESDLAGNEIIGDLDHLLQLAKKH